ncbi:uncharacterized protein LOC124129074 [Haliotis rufescens]|uniref:uncharacterized protein LOC124129074 n=1 Tax=Haliotis rufescens TaxID=6454 RepID=UPI00201F6C54|nr:uncharacterized protein LOC124129074 [Haliotis rufescens]
MLLPAAMLFVMAFQTGVTAFMQNYTMCPRVLRYALFKEHGYADENIPRDLFQFHPSLLHEGSVLHRVNHLKEFKLIGTGSQAEIFQGRMRFTDEDVIVKTLNTGDVEEFLHEAYIMGYLQDIPNIPRLYGFLPTGPSIADMSLVSEFLKNSTSLDELINMDPVLPECVWIDITRQITTTLQEIHKRFVLYNDLHTNNIIVSWQGSKPYVHITDFGHATFGEGLSYGSSTNTIWTREDRELYKFLAPEVWFDLTTLACDVYSVGNIMIYISPFVGNTEFKRVSRQCVAIDPVRRLPLRNVNDFLVNLYEDVCSGDYSYRNQDIVVAETNHPSPEGPADIDDVAGGDVTDDMEDTADIDATADLDAVADGGASAGMGTATDGATATIDATADSTAGMGTATDGATATIDATADATAGMGTITDSATDTVDATADATAGMGTITDSATDAVDALADATAGMGTTTDGATDAMDATTDATAGMGTTTDGATDAMDATTDATAGMGTTTDGATDTIDATADATAGMGTITDSATDAVDASADATAGMGTATDGATATIDATAEATAGMGTTTDSATDAVDATADATAGMDAPPDADTTNDTEDEYEILEEATIMLPFISQESLNFITSEGEKVWLRYSGETQIALAHYKPHNMDVVVKTFKDSSFADIRQEASVNYFMSNTGYVPEFIGVAPSGSSLTNLSIVQEYVAEGQTLRDVMHVVVKFHLQIKLALAIQLAQAMSGFHQRDLIISNFKTDNILFDFVDNYPVIKVIDLGKCTIQYGYAVSKSGDLDLDYLAPELKDKGMTSFASDVYGLGVILRGIFEACTDNNITGLIDRCLEKDPRLRPSSEQAVEHIVDILAYVNERDA